MMKYELKKYLSKRMNKLALATLLIVAVVVGFLAADSMRYTDTGHGKTVLGINSFTAGRRLASDKNRWKGELTPEKIADVVEKYRKLRQTYSEDVSELERTTPPYWDILYFAARIYYETEKDVVFTDLEHLAEEDIAHIYDTYEDNLKNMVEEYGKTPEQKKFMTEQFKKNITPVIYEAYDAWKTAAGYTESYILIIVVVLGFLAAGIIDEEFCTHAGRIFFTTKYGRTKAVGSKIAVGVLTTTMIYWASIGILSLISFGIMGVSGFYTSCRMEEPYMLYDMTQGQWYLLIVVCGYIASLLSASITMLVTAKMHTQKVAVFIPMFIYWILFILQRIMHTKFAYFLPSILVNMDNAIKYLTVFQMGKVVIRLIPFVMILYTIVSIVLLPFIYRSCSGYDAAKNLYGKTEMWNRIRRKKV